MGEARKEALRVGFGSQIKLEFHGAAITSDAGPVAYRELDETLALTAMADDVFRDPRRGKNTQHELVGFLRQSAYSRLAGYEETNDAERLAVDPAMRQTIGSLAKDRQGASTGQMGRLETEIRTARKKLKALMNLPGMWIDRARERHALDKLVLDVDSSVSETYGRQEDSTYNGHFECTCYHPILCFNSPLRTVPVAMRQGIPCAQPEKRAREDQLAPGERASSARTTERTSKAG